MPPSGKGGKAGRGGGAAGSKSGGTKKGGASSGKGQTPPPAAVPVAAAPVIQEDVWVECDLCQKWRRLPPGTIVDDDAPWSCSLNPDKAHASCEVPEEDYDASKEVVIASSDPYYANLIPKDAEELKRELLAKAGYLPEPAAAYGAPLPAKQTVASKQQKLAGYGSQAFGAARKQQQRSDVGKDQRAGPSLQEELVQLAKALQQLVTNSGSWEATPAATGTATQAYVSSPPPWVWQALTYIAPDVIQDVMFAFEALSAARCLGSTHLQQQQQQQQQQAAGGAAPEPNVAAAVDQAASYTATTLQELDTAARLAMLTAAAIALPKVQQLLQQVPAPAAPVPAKASVPLLGSGQLPSMAPMAAGQLLGAASGQLQGLGRAASGHSAAVGMGAPMAARGADTASTPGIKAEPGIGGSHAGQMGGPGQFGAIQSQLGGIGLPSAAHGQPGAAGMAHNRTAMSVSPPAAPQAAVTVTPQLQQLQQQLQQQQQAGGLPPHLQAALRQHAGGGGGPGAGLPAHLQHLQQNLPQPLAAQLLAAQQQQQQQQPQQQQGQLLAQYLLQQQQQQQQQPPPQQLGLAQLASLQQQLGVNGLAGLNPAVLQAVQLQQQQQLQQQVPQQQPQVQGREAWLKAAASQLQGLQGLGSPQAQQLLQAALLQQQQQQRHQQPGIAGSPGVLTQGFQQPQQPSLATGGPGNFSVPGALMQGVSPGGHLQQPQQQQPSQPLQHPAAAASAVAAMAGWLGQNGQAPGPGGMPMMPKR